MEPINLDKGIAIIQAHPDPAGHHLLHAMADAYAEGAAAAGHEVRRIEVAKLEFRLLRTQADLARQADRAASFPAAVVCQNLSSVSAVQSTLG